MRVVLATSNQGKLRELHQALLPLGWTLLQMPPGLTMPIEDGSTYEENALIKAAGICHALKTPTLADDSGLEVAALDGAPGVYSARFGGLHSDLDRNLFLLEAIKHVPTPRAAKFVAVLTLAFPDGHVESYRGEAHGEILEGPRGSGGHGYDPLFYVPSLGKTYAELSIEEKRHISHRGIALNKLLEAYKNGAPKREVSQLE
jgi:XTP/dITP diphosphohydrolase